MIVDTPRNLLRLPFASLQRHTQIPVTMTLEYFRPILMVCDHIYVLADNTHLFLRPEIMFQRQTGSSCVTRYYIWHLFLCTFTAIEARSYKSDTESSIQTIKCWSLLHWHLQKLQYQQHALLYSSHCPRSPIRHRSKCVHVRPRLSAGT
jgi:hypothetical protein